MSDRAAVIWTRFGGAPRKLANLVHTGAEVRLTYEAGAPIGVTAIHDVRQLAGLTIPFPVDAAFPLPPYLATLLPARGGPLWHFFLSRMARRGQAPKLGDEDWPMLLEAGRNGIGHLDVFAHDGQAEAWYAQARIPRLIGEDADRRGLWETFRTLAENTITDAKADQLEREIGPTPGVTGMIPKLLISADQRWLGLTDGVVEGIDVLIKTEPERYAGLLAMEAECYRIHRAAGCPVPDWWLRRSASGSPLLATRRFDRRDGQPLPLESFYSLLRMASLGRVRERWSEPTPEPRPGGEIVPRFETVADLLTSAPGMPAIGKVGPELFKRISLALMTGNSDLHLENLALLGGFGEAGLSPVYDPAPMRCYPQHSMTLALNFGGLALSRPGRHAEMWEKLIEFGKSIGVKRRSRAVDILLQCRDATAGYVEFLRARNDAQNAVRLADELATERTMLGETIAKT